MDAQDVSNNVWNDNQFERGGGSTDKGPTRAENQDAFWIPDQNTPTDLGMLYLVADGVGGQQDGAAAAMLAAETVHQLFYDLRQQGELIPDALKEALERANQTILDEAQRREVGKMGSTFVAAVQDGDKLIVAHVGDARAYLVRQGELRQLTRDDTWVQRQVDAGLITEEEAAGHEFRNVVTQVLGNKAEVNVNLSQTHVLQPGDVILLCSDGLYDVLPDSRMISITSENGPQSAARLLVEAAIDAEATDNITAVVMRTDQFVPIADEPTLVPLPVLAKTVPPPPVKDKGGIPRWLIGLAIIAIILIIAALIAFWLRNRNVAEDSMDAAATAMPVIVESLTPESAGALRDLDSTATEKPPAETGEPLATATSRPPDTPTPLPTPTLQATSEPRGCVNDGLFPVLWSDAQITDSNCDDTDVGLEAGDEVRILSSQPVSAGGSCGGGRFVKIQSAADPTVEGWMREDLIDLLASAESCSP